MLKINTNKRLCPFLEEPFDDCYCVKMSSQDIERAVYLCSRNYETCDIFKKRISIFRERSLSGYQRIHINK